MDYNKLIIVAILVEAIWENIKMIYKDNKFSVSMLGSLVIAITICILADIDAFAMLGINIKVPVVSNIFTGVICSRGANLVSDLFAKLKN